MNEKLDAYFGGHFLPFVVKEILVGVSQIARAFLEYLFWFVINLLFFGVVLPVLQVTGQEERFKRFVASLKMV